MARGSEKSLFQNLKPWYENEGIVSKASDRDESDKWHRILATNALSAREGWFHCKVQSAVRKQSDIYSFPEYHRMSKFECKIFMGWRRHEACVLLQKYCTSYDYFIWHFNNFTNRLIISY